MGSRDVKSHASEADIRYVPPCNPPLRARRPGPRWWRGWLSDTSCSVATRPNERCSSPCARPHRQRCPRGRRELTADRGGGVNLIGGQTPDSARSELPGAAFVCILAWRRDSSTGCRRNTAEPAVTGRSELHELRCFLRRYYRNPRVASVASPCRPLLITKRQRFGNESVFAPAKYRVDNNLWIVG
jgi:hypothetical protein